MADAGSVFDPLGTASSLQQLLRWPLLVMLRLFGFSPSRLLKNPTFDAGADGKFDYDARNIE